MQSIAMTDYEHVMGAPTYGKLIWVIDCPNVDQSPETRGTSMKSTSLCFILVSFSFDVRPCRVPRAALELSGPRGVAETAAYVASPDKSAI